TDPAPPAQSSGRGLAAAAARSTTTASDPSATELCASNQPTKIAPSSTPQAYRTPQEAPDRGGSPPESDKRSAEQSVCRKKRDRLERRAASKRGGAPKHRGPHPMGAPMLGDSLVWQTDRCSRGFGLKAWFAPSAGKASGAGRARTRSPCPGGHERGSRRRGSRPRAWRWPA